MLEKTLKIPKKRSSKTGLPPGTLVHIGEEIRSKIQIDVIKYNDADIHESRVTSFHECPDESDANYVTWINVVGLHDTELLRELEKKYNLHALVLEDIVNTVQRPKVEDYGDYLYIVLKKLYFDEEENIKAEQISLILMKGMVISFQEGIHPDTFLVIRDRIFTSRGRIRTNRADYLAYSLMDTIVDGYFGIMEILGERLELIEDEVELDPEKSTFGKLHRMKRDLIFFRRSVWPLREVPLALDRDTGKLIGESTRIYLRDIHDHVIQLIDINDSYRDMATGIFDMYLSSANNRLNEVMKLLTVVGTIFIPLTFMTGVYGMNFHYMPELELKGGYFMLLSAMGLVAGGMILYFKKKNWL